MKKLTNRHLQILLGSVWLLDGLLQLQHFMFTHSFITQVIDPVAQGQPNFVASSIRWVSRLIGSHIAEWNLLFATIQLAIGAGMFHQKTLKLALSISIIWSLMVWWFAEGFGGILTGSATPLTGAPGAVIIYALIAVLVWPDTKMPILPSNDVPTFEVGATFEGGRRIVERVFLGAIMWALLWLTNTVLLLLPGNSSKNSIASAFTSAQSGQPGWLRAIQEPIINISRGRGIEITVLLSAIQLLIAFGVFIGRHRSLFLVLGSVIALFCWVFGQSFGGILTGTATDPNTGPLIVLLALAAGLELPSISILRSKTRKFTRFSLP